MPKVSNSGISWGIGRSAAATVPRCSETLTRNRPTPAIEWDVSSSCSSSNRSRWEAGRMPNTMSRMVSLSRTGHPSMGRMAPCSRMASGHVRGEVEVRRTDRHRVAQQVVDVQRHRPVGGRRRNSRLEQTAPRSDCDGATSFGVRSSRRRPTAKSGTGGPAGSGRRPRHVQQLGDHHRVRQYRIDSIARPWRPSASTSSLGRRLGERHGQHVAVELQCRRPRTAGPRPRAWPPWHRGSGSLPPGRWPESGPGGPVPPPRPPEAPASC